MDIDSFYDRAVDLAKIVRAQVPLRFVILDDWRGGPRLVYDSPCAEMCREDCANCSLYLAVGEDPQPLPVDCVITSLIKSSAEDLKLFPGGQRQLNCKTLQQYLGCYVAWLREKCDTQEKIVEELSLVKGFLLVHPLLSSEDLKRIKKQIIDLAAPTDSCEKDRIIRQTASALGIC